MFVLVNTTSMSHLIVINGSRGSIHKHENVKRKLYNCKTNIYFNQQCIKKRLTPGYGKIKIPITSPASKYTQSKVPNMRIKDEIKYPPIKKQLNQQMYHLHLSLANSWNNTWPYIQSLIEDKLLIETRIKYKNLERKLSILSQKQTVTPQATHTFHPRFINNTNISFSSREITLLGKRR